MAAEEERLEAAARNSAGESKKTSETAQGTWLGGAQRGSLWLCYAEPLAEKRKCEISGKWHRIKPIPREKNSWGSWERRKKRVHRSRVRFR